MPDKIASVNNAVSAVMLPYAEYFHDFRPFFNDIIIGQMFSPTSAEAIFQILFAK